MEWLTNNWQVISIVLLWIFFFWLYFTTKHFAKRSFDNSWNDHHRLNELEERVKKLEGLGK